MGRSTASMARKRAEARSRGICIKCCKAKPPKGYAICIACNKRTIKQVQRRRREKREGATLQRVILEHEHAGDVARENHLHEDAAQHYQDALSVAIIDVEQRARISEKLAYSLSLSRTPTAAHPLFDSAFVSYHAKPAETERIIEIFMQRARQLHLDGRTAATIPLLMQAVEIAEASGDMRLCTIAHSRIADYLMGLARCKEAAVHIDAIREIPEGDSEFRATYYTQKGALAANFGKLEEAFAYFEQAIDAAHQDPDVHNIVTAYLTYAQWAFVLGKTSIAKTYFERTLLIARQYHITWRISHLCVRYADFLFYVGQEHAAHEQLREALSYDIVDLPNMEILLAMAGIRIALQFKDQETLARCARLSTIDLAFRSEVPHHIAYVAAAFAEWHAAEGRAHEAQALLHRALRAFDNVEVEYVWDFALAIARFGSTADIPAGRRLLEALVALPSSDIAKAYVRLFDAYVARRQNRQIAMTRHAKDAADRFRALEWYGFVDLAEALLSPTPNKKLSVRPSQQPFSGLHDVLTERERQVAELVLKGLTNHAIAKELSISKYTVSSHVASIMSRLGIRSRHQLVDSLPEA